MAYTIGELVWKITGDKSGLDKTLKSSQKNVESTGSAFKKAAKLIGGALVAIGIKNFTKEIVQLASDAEETANKFGVVFSQMAKDANDAAENLANNYGLSRTASKALLADTGDLLSGFGLAQDEALRLSSAAAQLGADLASFTNYAGGAEGATQALAAAMLGERERVKALGIALTETELEAYAARQGKVWKEMSKGEKASITLAAAMEQSKNSIGDFARSADSYANVQRRINAMTTDFKTELGDKLLPAVTDLGLAFLNASKSGGIIAKVFDLLVTSMSLATNQLTKFINTLNAASRETEIEKIDEKLKKLRDEFKELRKDADKNKEALKANLNEQERLLALRSGEVTQLDDLSNANDKILSTQKKELDTITSIIAGREYEIKKQKELTNAKKGTSQQQSEIVKNEKAELSGIDALLKDMESAGYWDSYTDQISRSEKATDDLKNSLEELTNIERFEMFNNVFNQMSSNILSILSSISATYDAMYEKRLEQLDAQMQKELEAAGVAEDTAVESAQAALDAAIEAGDEEEIAAAEKALKKAQIEEKYAKKKAQLEYEAELTKWKWNLGMAYANIPLAITNALASGWAAGPVMGPILGPLYASLAGAAAAAQLAPLYAAKPEPPAYAEGGIVPGSRSDGDNTLVKTTPGEMILNESQQARLLNIANGGGTGFSRVAPLREVLWDEIYQASKRGDLYIYDGAITSR